MGEERGTVISDVTVEATFGLPEDLFLNLTIGKTKPIKGFGTLRFDGDFRDDGTFNLSSESPAGSVEGVFGTTDKEAKEENHLYPDSVHPWRVAGEVQVQEPTRSLVGVFAARAQEEFNPTSTSTPAPVVDTAIGSILGFSYNLDILDFDDLTHPGSVLSSQTEENECVEEGGVGVYRCNTVGFSGNLNYPSAADRSRTKVKVAYREDDGFRGAWRRGASSGLVSGDIQVDATFYIGSKSSEGFETYMNIDFNNEAPLDSIEMYSDKRNTLTGTYSDNNIRINGDTATGEVTWRFSGDGATGASTSKERRENYPSYVGGHLDAEQDGLEIKGVFVAEK